MNSKIQKTSTLTLALGTALAMSSNVGAADNPFQIKSLSSGYVQLAAAKVKHISVLEGKCGNGKCGTARIRQMMDNNNDGRIERDEYVGWASRQAGMEFDNMSHGGSSVTPDDAYQNFLRWEENASRG